jgi:hypothetical protein
MPDASTEAPRERIRSQIPAMLRQPAPAPTDVRSVTLWFASPRRASVAAIRLMALIPRARFHLPTTPEDGAEGLITMVLGTVPAAEVEHAVRLIDVLSVPVAWDQRSAA